MYDNFGRKKNEILHCFFTRAQVSLKKNEGRRRWSIFAKVSLFFFYSPSCFFVCVWRVCGVCGVCGVWRVVCGVLVQNPSPFKISRGRGQRDNSVVHDDGDRRRLLQYNMPIPDFDEYHFQEGFFFNSFFFFLKNRGPSTVFFSNTITP